MQAAQCSYYELRKGKEYNAYRQEIENELIRKRRPNPKEAVLKEKLNLENAFDLLKSVRNDPNKTPSGLIMAQVQLLKAQRQLIQTHQYLIKTQGNIIQIQEDLITIHKKQANF
jgi:hypothetical protein